ncbi:MAG: restriction endonuclease subunit S [Treponema sp.]|nr:restriction endonuclease subunit S [Treponema sp.]
MIHSNNQNTVYLESPFYLKDGHGATSVLQSSSLNEINALYFITTIKIAISHLSYQEKATKIVLKNTFISLPTTKLGEIDFEYMGNYIQKIINDNLQIADSFLKENNLSNFVLTPSEKKAVEDLEHGRINTKDYTIASIFNIYSPSKRFNANAIEFGGKYPYVARGSENNGIRGFTSQNIQYLSKGNTISFGQDTATIYYQRTPYFTGDKIKVMELTDSELNENRAIYLISAMRKSFSTFAWGSSSFNEDILNNVIIKLPITKTNEINYDFMENYISAQKKLAMLPIIKTPEIEQNKREYDIEKEYRIMNVADKKDYYE